MWLQGVRDPRAHSPGLIAEGSETGYTGPDAEASWAGDL